MKHTKKMVMVPESEYFALMNMLKGGTGGDALQSESALMNAKIMKNLSDSKIGADVKEKRHSWLYKRRHQLKHMLENRPQKVVIENANQIPANVAPYMGIQKPTPAKQSQQENGSHKVPIEPAPVNKNILSTANNKTKSRQLLSTSTDYTSAEENGSTLKTPTQTSSQKKLGSLTTQHRTSPKNYSKILNIIGRNWEQYGVDKDSGQIMTNFNKPVKGSDYRQSLKYMTGENVSPPRGHSFFLRKLAQNPEIVKMFKEPFSPSPSMLTGKGKKFSQPKGRNRRRFVTVRFKPIKTPGIIREPAKIESKAKFKPLLWAKL